MENTILETKYIKVSFDEDIKLYTSIYLPQTENMTDSEWKQQMIELRDIFSELKPDYIIDDNRQRKYCYSPEIQKWTLELFVPLWNKIELKKYVQILPYETLGKLTSIQIEELSIDSFNMKYDYKMFEDIKSAKNWIIS